MTEKWRMEYLDAVIPANAGIQSKQLFTGCRLSTA
jgi:hypothetical protein